MIFGEIKAQQWRYHWRVRDIPDDEYQRILIRFIEGEGKKFGMWQRDMEDWVTGKPQFEFVTSNP